MRLFFFLTLLLMIIKLKLSSSVDLVAVPVPVDGLEVSTAALGFLPFSNYCRPWHTLVRENGLPRRSLWLLFIPFSKLLSKPRSMGTAGLQIKRLQHLAFLPSLHPWELLFELLQLLLELRWW